MRTVVEILRDVLALVDEFSYDHVSGLCLCRGCHASGYNSAGAEAGPAPHAPGCRRKTLLDEAQTAIARGAPEAVG